MLFAHLEAVLQAVKELHTLQELAASSPVPHLQQEKPTAAWTVSVVTVGGWKGGSWPAADEQMLAALP